MKLKDNIYYKNCIKKNISKLNINSIPDLLIIDNFYEDPMKIRNMALNLKYNQVSYAPGKRSTSFSCEELKEKLQYIINPYGEISLFPIIKENDIYEFDGNNNTYPFDNGNFNYFTANDSGSGWIHADQEADWAGIVYLTENAPINSGTEFYQFNGFEGKELYYNEQTYNKIRELNLYKDMSKWTLVDKVGNVFNRLVLFNAKKYHVAQYFFGKDINDARLTQTFWFRYNKKNILYKPINSKYNYLRSDVIVINDFYKNPIEVRNLALSQQYFRNDNRYPGERSVSFSTEALKEKIQSLLLPCERINSFSINTDMNRFTDNGCFQYATSNDRSWIHSDYPTDWAGVIYLTPDSPLSSGTDFYRFKYENSNIDRMTENVDKNIKTLMSDFRNDYTKWELIDRIGNVFNRLILFRSRRFHISGEYFGTDINNGRLFQVFFFSTENIG